MRVAGQGVMIEFMTTFLDWQGGREIRTTRKKSRYANRFSEYVARSNNSSHNKNSAET